MKKLNRRLNEIFTYLLLKYKEFFDDTLLGGRESPGAMVEANCGQKLAECYVKIYFCGGKGAALEIWQAWREQRRRQGRSGVRLWGRERWVLVFWDRDR